MCYIHITTYKCEKCNHTKERREGGYQAEYVMQYNMPPKCPKCDIAMVHCGSMELGANLTMKIIDKILPKW